MRKREAVTVPSVPNVRVDALSPAADRNASTVMRGDCRPHRDFWAQRACEGLSVYLGDLMSSPVGVGGDKAPKA